MSLESQGNVQAFNLDEITSSSRERASKYRKSYKKSRGAKQQCMSEEDALAVWISVKLSRHQYAVIRSKALEKCPSYKIVHAAKKPAILIT